MLVEQSAPVPSPSFPSLLSPSSSTLDASHVVKTEPTYEHAGLDSIMTPSDETSSLSTVLGKRKSSEAPSSETIDGQETWTDEDFVSTLVEGLVQGALEESVEGSFETSGSVEAEAGMRNGDDEEQVAQEGGDYKRIKLEEE